MNLVCKPLMNGIMVYWTEVENAAVYNVSLYINEQRISKRIIDRTEMYCTFTGLAAIDGVTRNTISAAAASTVRVAGGGRYAPIHSGMDYYVQVEAEDRNGNIIDDTERAKCAVREF